MFSEQQEKIPSDFSKGEQIISIKRFSLVTKEQLEKLAQLAAIHFHAS